MSAAQDTSSPASAAAVIAGRKISPKRKQEGDQVEGTTKTEAVPDAGDGAAVSPGKQKALGDSGKEGRAVGSGDLDSAPATSKKVPKSERKRAKEASRLEDDDDMMQVKFDSDGSFATNCGYLPCIIPRRVPSCGLSWTDVSELAPEAAGCTVLIRGWVQSNRSVGKKLTFLVLRDGLSSVQCVVTRGEAGIDDKMAQFARGVTKESFVRVEGTVALPNKPLQTTQQVELLVTKIYCISKSLRSLPFLFEDASRSYKESQEAIFRGKKLPDVALDIRLNNRSFDLRTPANQAIFRIQSLAESEFCNILRSKGFLGTHTPKITPGVSEGGSAVFQLNYVNGQTASLAQSPQLYKQMLINAGLKQVFEVGAVYRAEKSNTHRHLCEYIGLHAEMEIKEHYFEVIDVVDALFVKLFDHITEKCEAELNILNNQHPFEPLKYHKTTLKLKYSEAIKMLQDSEFEIKLFDDFSTQAERRLGELVRERYGTDFFILYEYPLALRPFYTMPCSETSKYSNSFDAFIRGEEILSGSQRIHSHGLLLKQISDSGIDCDTLKGFTDTFLFGAPPRGGFGAGLERLVMLYCGLRDIRMASLFPRDPNRLTP